MPKLALALLFALALAPAAHAAWPVKPLGQQHPIRGGFLDPRPGRDGLVFHTGIDISVRDDQPERGHPPYRTHRVYALVGGVVEYPRETYFRSCAGRMIRVGRFTYAHVDPVGVASPGYRVNAGDFIGWTCKGQWHLHLSERAQIAGQLVNVNPLRRGGILQPYVDVAAPVVGDLSFAAPGSTTWQVLNGAYASSLDAPALEPTSLRGAVRVRVHAGDPEGFVAWPPQFSVLAGERAPDEVRVTLRRLRDRALLWNHAVFRADYLPASGRPRLALFAPGTTQNVPAQQCLTTWIESGCSGRLWFALAPPGEDVWDTTRYENGRYELCATAADAMDNRSTSCTGVRIAN